MDPQALLEEVKHLVAQETHLPAENLQVNAPLDDLGIDSLDVLKLAARFEREFQITISTTEIQDIRTIDDIVARLTAKISS